GGSAAGAEAGAAVAGGVAGTAAGAAAGAAGAALAGAGAVAAGAIGAAGAETAAGAAGFSPYTFAMSGTIISATILMILISGFTAGPAVSLYGSPTVSPVTAALCASEPLPPW